MGRPLAIDDFEIDVPFPVDVIEVRVDGVESNFDNQTTLAKLPQIMGRIVKIVYSNNGLSENGHVVYAGPFRVLRKQLEEWKIQLPAELELTNTPSRAVAHIHLTHE